MGDRGVRGMFMGGWVLREDDMVCYCVIIL